MSLETVADLISTARVLLQDRVEPYRYETDQLVTALNIALQDARRIRPDFFLPDFEVPVYSSSNMGEVIKFPTFYMTSLLSYVTGWAHLRDEEDTAEARASAFIGTFTAQLTGKTYNAAGSVVPL